MNNTKRRHLEILGVAKEVLIESKIDIRQSLGKNLLPLAKIVAERTNCHVDTAKRNVAKAARMARGEYMAQWGGPRQVSKN